MAENFLISRVRGTHDLFDTRLTNFFSRLVNEHLTTYHFTQISTPILESLQLFKRSLGLETDVVSKEMFVIAPHGQQSAEELCLRPEATASIMRAFLEQGNLPTPWKVYLEGPMFRYERPQKGRLRQFHQVNLEIIGSAALADDVQVITLLDRLFAEKLLLDSYALRLNFLGCDQDRQAFKLELKKFLTKQQEHLCSLCLIRQEKNILRIFDCKQEKCQSIYQSAPKIAEHLCASCAQEWQEIRNLLELLSVSFSYDPYLVRGLDYYDKIVFEFTSDHLGSQSAFCGGGRYNGLARQLGAKKDIPAIGAAIGVERILLLLEQNKNKIALPELPPLFVLLPLSTEQEPTALLIADQLRAHNLCIDIITGESSLKNMMRAANKMAAHTALILGSEEQAEGTVTVKNMITGAQQKIAQASLVDYLLMQKK